MLLLVWQIFCTRITRATISSPSLPTLPPEWSVHSLSFYSEICICLCIFTCSSSRVSFLVCILAPLRNFSPWDWTCGGTIGLQAKPLTIGFSFCLVLYLGKFKFSLFFFFFEIINVFGKGLGYI